MKRAFGNVLIALLLISCIACGVQNTSKEKLTENAETSDEVTKAYNNYKNGKKDGLWKAFHKNGQLKNEGNYQEGQKEGLHKEWDKNGVLLTEGFYENGKANGLMKWYHNGHLAAQGAFKDGKRTGLWKISDIEHVATGEIGAEGHFKEGKEVGLWTYFYKNGQVRREDIWENHTIISSKCWDKKGSVIDCK